MGILKGGWRVENGSVWIPTQVPSFTGYRFILEAIYDGHIPLKKVAGYYLRSNRRLTSSHLLQRDTTCTEDRLTLVSTLSKLLIVEPQCENLDTQPLHGTVFVKDIRFTSKVTDITSTVLTTSSEDTISMLFPTSINMCIRESTGFVTADDNYHYMLSKSTSQKNRTRFFPMYSNHTLLDYVKVLPFNGGKQINLRYENGMCDRYFSNLLGGLFSGNGTDDWWEDIKRGVIC